MIAVAVGRGRCMLTPSTAGNLQAEPALTDIAQAFDHGVVVGMNSRCTCHRASYTFLCTLAAGLCTGTLRWMRSGRALDASGFSSGPLAVQDACVRSRALWRW